MTTPALDPAQVYLRDGDRFINWNTGAVHAVGTTPPDPDPDPTPEPADWDAMLATGELASADAYFAGITGYQGNGYNYGDLDPGSLSSTSEGQVIEGIRGGAARWAHSGVTYRNCHITGSSTYGAFANPTFGAPHTGVVFENCSFEIEGTPLDKAGVLTNPSSPVPSDATFRFCRFRGWSSGFLAQGGVTAEYCWTNDFYGSSTAGAHVSSFNARGTGIRAYRNYFTEGGSPLLSIYFDQRPVANVTLTENILSGASGNNLPSYLLFGKVGDYEAGATDVVVGGNYFGTRVDIDYRFGLQAGFGAVPWGTNGNVRTPNLSFFTGDPL